MTSAYSSSQKVSIFFAVFHSQALPKQLSYPAFCCPFLYVVNRVFYSHKEYKTRYIWTLLKLFLLHSFPRDTAPESTERINCSELFEVIDAPHELGEVGEYHRINPFLSHGQAGGVKYCYSTILQKVTPVKTKATNLKVVRTATAATLEMSSHWHVIPHSQRQILKTTSQKCSGKVILKNFKDTIKCSIFTYNSRVVIALCPCILRNSLC